MHSELKTGQNMYKLMGELYPIGRSITGDGLRQTLSILQKYIPLKITEVPSGTKVFDWTVPKEWNIKGAHIRDKNGDKILDLRKSNLHVMNYSVPVKKKLSLKQLRRHMHTLPEFPDRIPYITSYYSENWGFCMAHRDYQKLKHQTYEVLIDSVLKPGSLTYGEYYLPGRMRDEILLSTYVCHPSLANDNLSGVVLLTYMARILKNRKMNYSYRFLFTPETIGTLAWIEKNEKNLPKIKHGLVATCVGDSGNMTYKKSRIGNAVIDRAAEKMLLDSGDKFQILDFSPTGSDERQFCSPGFNLPVGSLMRTPYGKFSQYHTSADNLKFINSKNLADSLVKYLQIIEILENNQVYLNLYPKGEPMLGKRGLYNKRGNPSGRSERELARLWVLNQSDGTKSLLDISLHSHLKFSEINSAAQELLRAKLIRIINPY